MEDGNGFSVRDALNKKYTGLANRDAKAHELHQSSSIYISRIGWPGYRSWNRQVKTKNWRKDPKLIILSKLGTEIAKSVKLFINQMHTEPIWQVGPAGSTYINTDKLVLIALKQMSKSSWQPALFLRD